MFSNWLIRFQHGSAYIWQRKYCCGLFAIPWTFHGGTRIIITEGKQLSLEEAAISYIRRTDPNAIITMTFTPWCKPGRNYERN